MSSFQTDRKGKKTFRIEQALKEKETGNTLFKKGSYKKAIEHYGKAMELDPREATFVINRAMAHLKMKNWAEAENDCTRGLLLHPDNVKALWRRGIARREMGKLEEAKKDLEDALRLEPNDQAVNDEYTKVMDAIHAIQVAQKETLQNASISNTAETIVANIPRRRLTVEEVEFDEDEHIIESAKKLQLTNNGKNGELKKELAEPTEVTHQKIIKPRTMIEFERDWDRFKGNNEELYNFIKIIPPDTYPTLFSEFFEADHLSRIVVILKDFFLERESINDVYDTLYYLSRVERFDIILIFLEDKDKQGLEVLFRALIESSKDSLNDDKRRLTKATFQEVANLIKVYGIRGLQ